MNRAVVTALLFTLVHTAGCSDEPGAPRSTADTSSSGTSATSGPSGAQPSTPRHDLTGTWTRRLHEREALTALGVGRATVNKIMGWEGEGVADIVYKFDGGSWTQFQVTGGETEVGDAGSYRFDGAGHMVLTSRPGGGTAVSEYVFEVTIDGDELTTRMTDHASDDDPLNLRVTRMVTEGTYHRVDR